MYYTAHWSTCTATVFLLLYICMCEIKCLSKFGEGLIWWWVSKSSQQGLGAEIRPQEVHSLHSNRALLLAFKLSTLVVKSCALNLLVGGSWEIQSIVHLNKRCFNHCLCHLEFGVLQQLKLLQWLVMIHWSKIVYKSYSSHDKIKEQCCLLCIVLNFWLSKLHNPSGIFLCGNPYMHFHSWWSRGI